VKPKAGRSKSAGAKKARKPASPGSSAPEDIVGTFDAGAAKRLFSSIVSPLLIVDPDGRVLEANAAALEAFGRDMAGRTYQDVFRLVGRDPIAICLATGKAQHRVEVPGEGDRLWGITISPFELSASRRGAVIGCRDLTELRRMEEALATAERHAIIGRLAAIVAHEVNNPLGAIKAHIKVITRALPPESDIPPRLEIISTQVDRIARTVRLLLGFSRQRSTPVGAADPLEVIRTVTALFEGGFGEKGIEMSIDLPPSLPSMKADVDQVQEILVNLLENARDILPSGSHFELTVRVQGHDVEFVVEDDGPGLGNEPSKVFEPFFTTKASGTGLGLSIARRIAISLEGNLTAENRATGGARFRVRIPAAD
jgi:signal transduction histidine kinase